MNIVQTLVDPLAHSYNLALSYFSAAIVAMAERIYIFETDNYTSNIWANTNGAGAEAPSQTYPYGWGASYQNLWGAPWLKPTGLYNSPNGANYLKFPTFTAGLIFLCTFLSNNNNDPTAWNGGEDSTYSASISAIQNKYIV